MTTIFAPPYVPGTCYPIAMLPPSPWLAVASLPRIEQLKHGRVSDGTTNQERAPG